MLDHITPVVLTYNEGPNIARTLSHLGWARNVVVVDSGSTDDTIAILARFSNVRIFDRRFDTPANQWRYAVTDTGIATPWIFRLDADYQLSDELVQELRQLDPEAPVSAYRIAFDYAIFSRKLRSSLYPPNTILLRQGRFKVWDNGHTESWAVEGPIRMLHARVTHDDWKGTDFWMNAQGRYMRRELEKLEHFQEKWEPVFRPKMRSTQEARAPSDSNKTEGALASRRSRLRDWLRLRPPLMPFAVFLYCLFGKGLILNGRAGLFYALQRMVAEAALSLMVLEARLRASVESAHVKDVDD